MDKLWLFSYNWAQNGWTEFIYINMNKFQKHDFEENKKVKNMYTMIA